MYAIVKAGGTQFKVAPSDVVRIPKSADPEGAELKLGEVLLVRSRDNVLVGRPTVAGAEVAIKVLRHGRYRKGRGFKFKKRKKYRRTWGFREAYTEVVVTGISAPGVKPEEAEQAPKEKKAVPRRSAEPKAAVKKETKPRAKKPGTEKKD